MPVFCCDLCDAEFDRKDELKSHKAKCGQSSGTTNNHSSNLTDAEKKQILSHYTDEQILAKLVERHAAFVCKCGIIFRDQTLYYLHRGCHNTNDPKMCSFCEFKAKDWYDFTTHFFTHKKK